jgi:hypothetical protein
LELQPCLPGKTEISQKWINGQKVPVLWLFPDNEGVVRMFEVFISVLQELWAFFRYMGH